MNRFVSTLVVLAMALVAVGAAVWQTWVAWVVLGDSRSRLLLAAAAVLAVLILSAMSVLITAHYRRRVPAARRSRFEIVQPLRRLFSTVWS